MPDLRRANCQGCGKHRDEVGNISWRGLCESCGIERATANNLQISAGRGPYADHRLRRTIMAARRALVASEQGEA